MMQLNDQICVLLLQTYFHYVGEKLNEAASLLYKNIYIYIEKTEICEIVRDNREFPSDFLGLNELGADQTLQAIMDGFTKLITDAGLDWTTTCSECTDGAAVCTTVQNQLIVALQQQHLLSLMHT